MAAKKTKKRESAGSLEDRVAHTEKILGAILDAHGETYPGAGADRAKLPEGTGTDES
jgi:hypothetical protein